MESIKLLLEQKLLYAPGHEFGMVMFNSDETSNYLNDQNNRLCQNVATVRGLMKIDLEFMRDLESFTPNLDQT